MATKSSTRTNSLGFFEFQLLRPDDYQLIFESEDYCSKAKHDKFGRSNVIFRREAA